MTVSDRLLERIHALTPIDKNADGTYTVEDIVDATRCSVKIDAFDRLGIIVRRIDVH